MNLPNIILIVIDCLRIDHLKCYQSKIEYAPNLEKLATHGLVFTQNIAMGYNTLTSMPAIITGTYPGTFGGFTTLKTERPRLANDIKKLGYTTGAFISNPYVSHDRGYSIGFDVFNQVPPTLSRRSTDIRGLSIRALNRVLKYFQIKIECPPYLPAGDLTNKAIEWVESLDAPFFLVLHYMDTHTPYNLEGCSLILPLGKGKRKYDLYFWDRLVRSPKLASNDDLVLAKKLYASGLNYIDQQIDLLIQKIDSKDILDNTIFIITADHGESFLEHDVFGHSNHLYEEIIHVPLIFSGPKHILPSRIIQEQIQHIDLPPTIMEMLGEKPNPKMHGRSYLSLIKGNPTYETRPVFSQTNPEDDWEVSLRDYPWKLIWHLTLPEMETKSFELYNLSIDEAEENNLFQKHSDIVKKMKAQIEILIRNYQIDHDYTSMKENVSQLDDELTRRLQDLGYLE